MCNTIALLVDWHHHLWRVHIKLILIHMCRWCHLLLCSDLLLKACRGRDKDVRVVCHGVAGLHEVYTVTHEIGCKLIVISITSRLLQHGHLLGRHLTELLVVLITNILLIIHDSSMVYFRDDLIKD